jgi:UPF0755 protein
MRAWLLLGVVACADPSAVVDPLDSAEVLFEVPKGATGKKVGELLEQQGLVGSAWNWGMVLRQSDGGCIKAGKHALRKNMTVAEVLTTLCGAPIPDDVPFTVLEGWRIRDIDKALAEKGWITPGEYAALATSKAVEIPFSVTSPTLEGYLYPETYMVPPDAARFEPARLIERQLATFQERFLRENEGQLGARTLHEVVVVASMVEREEPTDAQRPIVAGIMWKRLDAGTPLGIDATSRYHLENWEDEKAFRAVLKNPADTYGTRVRAGLPPGAIGNPTLTSLLAAVKPENSEYWYYLHDGNGVFHGGRNAAEHDANRRKYNVW